MENKEVVEESVAAAAAAAAESATISMMTERDYLLSRFPVDETELDALLVWYDEQRYNREHAVLESSSVSSSLLLEAQLPELLQILQTAVETVYVVVGPSQSSSNPHSSDDYNDAATSGCAAAAVEFHEKTKFLEAAVSVCGRRGDRFLLEAMYDSANTTATVAAVAKNDEERNRVVLEHYDASANYYHLASLVYRLCVTCHRLLQTSTTTTSANNNSDDDDDEPSAGHDDDCQDRKEVMKIPEAWIDFFASLAKNKGQQQPDEAVVLLSLGEWKDWANRTKPSSVAQSLSTVFYHFFFGAAIITSSTTTECHPCRPLPFQLPTLIATTTTAAILADQEESRRRLPWWSNSPQQDRKDGTTIGVTAGAGAAAIRIPLQLALMGLGGSWRPIFQSDCDGLSFRTFAEALTGFCGPTVILVETTKGERLGYFSTVPWKTSPNWFSSSCSTSGSGSSSRNSSGDDNDDGYNESFLFRLHPSWSVYYPQFTDGRPKKYHQFLNLPVSQQKNTNKDNLVGLAVGGVAPNVPRLHINPSLENCKACAVGSVFDSGPLLASEEDSYFDIASLEVWAVRVANDGSFERGVQAGELRAAVKESARQWFAKVDRAQFVDDFASGAYVNSLFQHRAQARGRADFVADAEGEGYFVDGKQPNNGRCCTSKMNDDGLE